MCVDHQPATLDMLCIKSWGLQTITIKYHDSSRWLNIFLNPLRYFVKSTCNIPEVLNQWIIGYILCILELEWITYKYYLTVSTNHKWSEWYKKE